LLGDGNLHVDRKNYARLTIDHGITQSDYQSWKAKLLSDIFERDVKCRNGHKGKSIQVQVADVRMRSWYKIWYLDRKKNLSSLFPFIRHNELATAVWLMDDGYAEPSISKLATGEKKNYGARLRIFTCDQSKETQIKIQEWFKSVWDVTAKIKHTTRKKDNKTYPFIKFGQEDSLKIWEKIREFVLQFKSMQYKFRYMEQIYQSKLLKRIPAEIAEDIVLNPK
jgi:hypothetical protein